MDTQETTIKEKIKAVVLLSGGLDSAIAAQLVIDQGIDVYALNFHSSFCTCESNSENYGCGAVNFARKMDIPMKSIVKGNDYFDVIKHPQFGYGRNINPCIDCRLNILKYAHEYMKEIGASFIITGEVLGQRPKSQTIRALKIIEKHSGLKGKILRPLSAKLLEPTEMEINGIIDREKLLNIKGRRRNIQVELGREYNLIEQYCAGGGCRLTEKNFANKLRDYLDYNVPPDMSDMKFLRIGRHFRINKIKYIVGRDASENKQLTAWARKDDFVLEISNVQGPTILVENPQIIEDINTAGQLAVYYSRKEILDFKITILKNKEIELEYIPNIMKYDKKIEIDINTRKI